MILRQKQKRNRHHLSPKMLSALVILVLAIATFTVVTIRHNTTEAAPAAQKTFQLPQRTPGKPEFSFAGTPAWTKGPADKVSLALFRQGGGCFVSIQHKPGTVEITSALHKRQDSLASNGYTVTPGNTLTVSVQTPSGQKQYELHQSSVITPAGAAKVEGGQEFGYLQLNSGYLETWGYCDTFDQLPLTIPALQAIKFTESL